MKHGFTTGSCSAAAAKAATYMLLSGNDKNEISIETPSGIAYTTDILDITKGDDYVKCAVRKDGGDDPDVTTGCLIYAKARLRQIENVESPDGYVIIDGGIGVGRVTRPGLDQEVGNAAINSVPRKMIEAEVKQVMEAFDYSLGIEITISVPDGELVALKTFNPRLGIEGGISIIGTSGIVEPMSTKAIIDTIRVELKQRRAEGKKSIVITPGNYGLEFMNKTYGYDLDKAVKCSNYIGEAIDIVKELGYEKMVLTGHMGKLIKLSGGIMNTHSKEADSRMELMAAAAVRKGASIDTVNKILDSLTTEEAFKHIIDGGIRDGFSEYVMERIMFYLKKRAGDLNIECIMYSNEYGLIAASSDVDFGRLDEG